MSQDHIYAIPKAYAQQSYITPERYQALYQHSLQEPELFWAEQADKFVTWFQMWDQVQTGNFTTGDVKWFVNGKLNVCYNCVDRHLPQRSEQTAILWQGDEPENYRHITYHELFEQVCRFANLLKQRGVKKGDRVCIYMPMIPEASYAMLACARIGAIHSVVFGGFSADALRSRILDADCSVLITADEAVRGGKTTPLKQHADAALQHCPNVHSVIVVKHTNANIEWHEHDVCYQDAIKNLSAQCEPEAMDAEDPLFILYTSGSTGKPKGVLHTTGGYLVYAAATHKYVFDYHEGDVYWCTADIGWITGHSYIVYGPLCNGAITLMFEGTPHYPDASRFWQVVDQHQVNIFYTAPTAIRALMKEGDAFVKATQRSSLKLLGTVGEPINPEVWEWYHRTVGEGRCPIVDTWWQTETGGILLTSFPGAMALKPGSAGKPFFGIEPEVIHEQLVIAKPWPGVMRTVYGDHQRFLDTYLKEFPGKFLTGDGVRVDEEGYYWLTGRMDDVINVSGHRLGTAEIESALLEHAGVAEAAVVGIPHEVKGQGIYAYVTLKSGIQPSEALKQELSQTVRDIISPIAKPDTIQWAAALPKTRSGKIMRRILRKLAVHDVDNLGDTSTLADPSVIDDLLAR